MPTTTLFRARRLVLAALVAVPLSAGVAVSAAELTEQGLVHWFTDARRQHEIACANGTAPPSMECRDDR